MSDTSAKNTDRGGSEKTPQDRTYALLYKLNEEVRQLSVQIRALKKLIEGDVNR